MLDVTKNDIILYSVVVACREWRKRGRQFFFRGREPRLTVHCCRLRSDMPKATTIAFLLAAVGTSLVAHSSSALAQSQPCRSIEYERYAYTICEVDLHKHTARLYWKRSDGKSAGMACADPSAWSSCHTFISFPQAWPNQSSIASFVSTRSR